jgi:type IV pilus assembly protein PilX
MTDFRRLPSLRPRQRGAVLFIALIMLLLLTLIGITAMQVTLLQERMAGGFRVQHQAFEQTEGTLKDTRKNLNDAANSSGPLYYSADAALSSSNALPWSTWLTTEPTVADPDDGISQVNAHIAVGSPPAVIGARQLKYFVVSALNEDPGGSGDAKSAVQAVFIY